MKTIQRTFIPGSEWIYFKIYMGRKSVDRLLLEHLSRLWNKLLKENLIDKCFFLRYSDPDFHLRFRMHLVDVTKFGPVVGMVNNSIRKFIAESLIYRVELSTYVREIERYGEDLIEVTETIFTIDSKAVIELLKLQKGISTEYKWMFAIMWIDMLLDVFCNSLTEKSEIMERLSNSYRAEFGYTKYNAKQLNMIFRAKKKKVEKALSWNIGIHDDIMEQAISIGKRFQKNLRSLNRRDSIAVQNVTSYLHMFMNRYFSIDNRTCELLIYDFMNRCYKSEIVRMKMQK